MIRRPPPILWDDIIAPALLVILTIATWGWVFTR